jgi:hypothetical protein
LLLVVGAGIAFAGGALQGGDGGPGLQPNQPHGDRPPAPMLLPPAVGLTREGAIDVAGALPAGFARAQADKLRIYVNGDMARERNVPSDSEFVVNDVPLQEGENSIQAALVNEAGESERSAPMTVTRDSTPPVIRITNPDEGALAYSNTEFLRGRTEAGATLEIHQDGGGPVAVNLSGDGTFAAEVVLNPGSNSFVLLSEDTAGNKSSKRVDITRGTSLASVTLTVSSQELALADLPTNLDVAALVRDESGRASEGAQVTFGLSPPNRGTTTYRATTSGGEARWSGMPVTGDAGAAGTWLVTILVELPNGEELRDRVSFSVQ